MPGVIENFESLEFDLEPSVGIAESQNKPKEERTVEIINQVYHIVLQDWMYGFDDLYSEVNFTGLYDRITDLVSQGLPLKFFLPGFPVKSPNKQEKVFGEMPDFAEFLAIRTLLTTARKLQAVYHNGVVITILSDYHTFDQYIGVNEDAYLKYHRGLRQMITDAGADDVIELISLSTFPEFENVPGTQLSTVLSKRFGGEEFRASFDEAISNDPALLRKYKQLRKFMLADLKPNLPGSKSSKTTKRYIKEVTRGMMAQGVALDNFLKQQSTVRDFIRLSIHNHHPESGKFAVDLFKGHVSNGGILRTPWHHVVVFDSLSGIFMIDHKTKFEKANIEGSVLVKVRFNGQNWLFIRLYIATEFDHHFKNALDSAPFEVMMYRGGCGMIIKNKLKNEDGIPISSDCFTKESLSSLVKEFGLVVLRNFREFADEDDMIRSYRKRANRGMLEWQFGLIHKVKPIDVTNEITSSYEGLPMHFDMVALPPYMGISQDKHRYEDYVAREFLLYCNQSCLKEDDGQTTFTDAHAAVTSMNGEKIKEWKETILQYETHPTKQKETYFGGLGNVYEYPLVTECPWTGKDVLRWLQSWSAEEHPNSRQVGWHRIKSSPAEMNTALGPKMASDALELEIRKVAFDERFYFGHSYAKGDQVYVNNYTTLHGRNGFQIRGNFGEYNLFLQVTIFHLILLNIVSR